MTTFPNSPKLIKGGIALIDPQSAQVKTIISLQYNPESLTRTLQIQGITEGADRSEALRLKAPAVETIKFDAEIDATDQLELPDQNKIAVEQGIQPQLALLESLVQPTSAQLNNNNQLAQSGILEIAPMEAALALFVWSKQRIVPVRVTDFTITEEAFDPSLNPTRAKVSIGLRVLSVEDLGFQHKGGSLFMTYLQNKEQSASKAATGSFATLGIGGIG
jgi:hypothetical protein